jgi:hypothetical protein
MDDRESGPFQQAHHLVAPIEPDRRDEQVAALRLEVGCVHAGARERIAQPGDVFQGVDRETEAAPAQCPQHRIEQGTERRPFGQADIERAAGPQSSSARKGLIGRERSSIIVSDQIRS